MSWWQLDTVLKERIEYAMYYRAQQPVACPNDGQPLVNAPTSDSGSGCQLYCPYDGWQFPRDYDPDVHSGM